MRAILSALALAAFAANAADIKVMSAGAVKAAFNEATEQWSKDTEIGRAHV